jgi:hypothetical protein
MSKEGVLQYLKPGKIDEEQAAQVHEPIGGGMVHPKSIADDIEKNRIFEGMCTACYTENSFSPPL